MSKRILDANETDYIFDIVEEDLTVDDVMELIDCYDLVSIDTTCFAIEEDKMTDEIFEQIMMTDGCEWTNGYID